MWIVSLLPVLALAQDPAAPVEAPPPAPPPAADPADEVRQICAIGAEVPANPADPNPIATLTAAITPKLTTGQAQRLWSAVAAAPPDQRAWLLSTQAWVAGVEPCALAEDPRLAPPPPPPAPDPVADGPVDSPPPTTDGLPEDLAAPELDGSFGVSLAALTREITWSGYADVVFTVTGDSANFEASHFNPIIGARLHDTVYGEAELEFEHNGLDVKLEYAYLDWQPANAFTVRVGQLLVPIGEFNDRLHPSFRWNQVTRPAMFRDIPPAIWADTGLELFGELDGKVRVNWATYVVNGLGGGGPGEFVPDDDEPLRALRAGTGDNNTDKGVGGRVRLTAHPGGTTSYVSASAYHGALDPDNGSPLAIVDAAWEVDARVVGLRGEFAQTFIDYAPFERGLYAQVWARAGKFTPAARFDMTQRDGEGVLKQRAVASVLYTARPFWSLRAEGSVGTQGDVDPALALMSAFSF